MASPGASTETAERRSSRAISQIEIRAIEEHAGMRNAVFAQCPVRHRCLADLAATVRKRFPEVLRLAIAHRVGVVRLGEAAVVVVASAPHRGPAFDAAAFAIDELKRTLPVWKKEVWAEGSAWSELGAVPIVPSATAEADNLHPVSSGGHKMVNTALGGDPGT